MLRCSQDVTGHLKSSNANQIAFVAADVFCSLIKQCCLFRRCAKCLGRKFRIRTRFHDKYANEDKDCSMAYYIIIDRCYIED
jgi:hypothetical protein